MTLIKICGLKEVNMVQHAIACGADAIGFVFAKSKRQISVHLAKEIVATVNPSIMIVGVFVNEDSEVVNHIADEVGLTHIQLHGQENEEYIKRMNRPVWKAVSVQSKADMKVQSSYVEAYLFDSGSGGTGEPFPWELLKEIETTSKIIVAGGLHIGNVQEAINIVKPYMVDVSSGVEEHGQKNMLKIEQFIKTARGELQ